jgi:hypothetical protein
MTTTINQSNYNPDELAWEVITTIREQITAAGGWDLTLNTTFELDQDLFSRVAEGDDSNRTRDEWMSVEDEWRSIARKFGIEVYDDGEAGITLVGPTNEIDVWVGLVNEQ